MKNSLCDLNDHLFMCLEALTDDTLDDKTLDAEIKRAKAVSSIASQIVANATVQLDAIKISNRIEETSNIDGKNQILPEMLLPKNTSSNKRLK